MYAEIDAQAICDATGAHMQSGERTFVHATGFVLRPDGKVATASYATGPIGRFTASEVLRSITFARSQAAR